MRIGLLALAVYLAAQTAAAGTKDTFTSDYFDITLEGGNWTQGYSGPVNFTVNIWCRNVTDLETPPLLVPYELVNYSLYVRTLGALEPMEAGTGQISFIFKPGACHYVLHPYFFVTPFVRNLTLVHMVQPAHSRLPGRELNYRFALKNTTVMNQTMVYPSAIGIYYWLTELTKKTLNMALLFVGAVLLPVSALLYMFHQRGRSYLVFMASIALIFIGLIV